MQCLLRRQKTLYTSIRPVNLSLFLNKIKNRRKQGRSIIKTRNMVNGNLRQEYRGCLGET